MFLTFDLDTDFLFGFAELRRKRGVLCRGHSPPAPGHRTNPSWLVFQACASFTGSKFTFGSQSSPSGLLAAGRNQSLMDISPNEGSS